MKNRYLTILLILAYNPLFAQLQFQCEQLDIYHILEVQDTSDLIQEEHGGGPCLSFTCELKNITDTTVCLTSYCGRVEITFYYKGKLYRDEPIIHGINKERVILKPSQKIKLHFASYIFFFTGIFYNHYKTDYRKNMIEILPTLCVEYIDEGIESVKCVIKSVNVHY